MSITPQSAPATSAKACAAYISDDGYLFPSLVSALQMRRNVSDKADVVMYYIGTASKKSALFQSVYETLGIKFNVVPLDAIHNMHIMFARLFVDNFVDPNYSRILYIDGDTQIEGSIDPLLGVKLPPNKFGAVRDPLTLVIDAQNSDPFNQRKYFEGIGLSSERLRNYFNSGVLLFERDCWRTVCSDALHEIRSRKTNFRFPDQDPLNLVAGEKSITLSYRWNFPAFMLNTKACAQVEPRILHFMSNPRPWQGPFWPWGRNRYAIYLDLVKNYPQLEPYRPALSTPRYVKYFLQQYYKKMSESAVWQSQDLLDRMTQIEAGAFI